MFHKSLWLRWSSALLISVTIALGGCATTQSKKHASDSAQVKKRQVLDDKPKNYSLYTMKDLDKKLLKRGEQMRWSRSLDGN